MCRFLSAASYRPLYILGKLPAVFELTSSKFLPHYRALIICSCACYAEIKHNYWLFQIMWLRLTNHNALFHCSIAMLCNAEIKHDDWLFQILWLRLTNHNALFNCSIAKLRLNLWHRVKKWTWIDQSKTLEARWDDKKNICS